MRISFNKATEFFPIPFGIKASSVITVSALLMDWTRTSWIQVGETLEQKIARFGGGGGKWVKFTYWVDLGGAFKYFLNFSSLIWGR